MVGITKIYIIEIQTVPLLRIGTVVLHTSDARGEEIVAIQDSNHALPGFNWALSLESLIAYVKKCDNRYS